MKIKWESLELDRTWDTRWTSEQKQEAILRAEQQAREARMNLERLSHCIEFAARQLADAHSWIVAANLFAKREPKTDE